MLEIANQKLRKGKSSLPNRRSPVSSVLRRLSSVISMYPTQTRDEYLVRSLRLLLCAYSSPQFSNHDARRPIPPMQRCRMVLPTDNLTNILTPGLSKGSSTFKGTRNYFQLYYISSSCDCLLKALFFRNHSQVRYSSGRFFYNSHQTNDTGPRFTVSQVVKIDVLPFRAATVSRLYGHAGDAVASQSLHDS